jgi:hypothetical protein
VCSHVLPRLSRTEGLSDRQWSYSESGCAAISTSHVTRRVIVMRSLLPLEQDVSCRMRHVATVSGLADHHRGQLGPQVPGVHIFRFRRFRHGGFHPRIFRFPCRRFKIPRLKAGIPFLFLVYKYIRYRIYLDCGAKNPSFRSDWRFDHYHVQIRDLN